MFTFSVGDSPLFGWADYVPYGETFLAVGGNQLEGDTGPETQLTTIYIFNKVQIKIHNKILKIFLLLNPKNVFNQSYQIKYFLTQLPIVVFSG